VDEREQQRPAPQDATGPTDPRDGAAEPIAGLDDLLDRVDPDALEELSTAELRTLRRACEDTEEAVSYARRLLQGRLDILRAELLRRQDQGDGEAAPLIDALPSILASDHVATQTGNVRSTRVRVPPAADDYAERLDAIADEEALTASDDTSLDELQRIVARFSDEERTLSSARRELFTRIDGLRAELAARYKDGRADVSELLADR
jgi:hypothetical protein